MISVSDLRFAYPGSDFQLAVDSLEISAAQKIAVVGPSGSGKTTLLNLISGISVPSSGKVTVDGITISGLSDSARRNFRIGNIGMVFQQFELVEYLNARDNILLPFEINRSLTKTSRTVEQSVAVAERLGLGDKLRRYPHQLSQGEQQRVAICRAVATEPKLILADEPTGNLDPANKSRIMELLFEQVALAGQTLVVVTHDMSLLDGFDRVVDFQQFRVTASATEAADGLA